MNSKDLYKVNGSESELGMIWEPEEEEEFGRSRARPMRFSQSRRILSRPTKRPVRRPRRPIPRRRPRRPLPINLGGSGFTEPEPQSQGSEYVRWVQTMLNQALNLRLSVHGILDVQTRSAIRSFQEKNSLPVTGIVGPDTERALMGTKDGQAPVAGAAKPEEPAAQPTEPGAAPQAEPDSSSPAEEYEFEWESAGNRANSVEQKWFENEYVSFESETSFLENIQNALASGQWYLGLGLAVLMGIRDENKLSSMIFFARHPERDGRKIEKSEPDFKKLSQEWLAIRDQIVRPFLAKAAAQAGVPTKPTLIQYVKDFSGPAAECTTALTRAGKTRAEALAIINTQIGVAITMLRKAANDLKRGSRSSATRNLFLKIFRVRPEFVPTWLKQTATIKDRGDVVATRCSRIADLLASGRIRFFCTISSTNCPDCGNDPRGFACSSWGDESSDPKKSNVICFGNAFWDAMRAGDTQSILATVMHEPFHIYYGKYVTQHVMTRGKFGGIDCILTFVFETNGRVAPGLEKQGCTNRAVRKEI